VWNYLEYNAVETVSIRALAIDLHGLHSSYL